MKKMRAILSFLMICLLILMNFAMAETVSAPVDGGLSGERNIFELIIEHITDTITVFDLVIPYYFIYFAALVVLIIIVLIIVAIARKGKADVADDDDDDDVLPPVKKNQVKFVIQYQGSVESVRFEIDGTLRIGREMNTLPINPADHAISRKHCELYYMNDVLMLRDFSSNGTIINGNLCSHLEQIINSGDVIKIGEHTITISF